MGVVNLNTKWKWTQKHTNNIFMLWLKLSAWDRANNTVPYSFNWQSHNIRAYVSVGGTDQDHEGTWIYKRTGRPVVFTGGYLPGRPSTRGNCLHLDFWNSQGKIIDEYCVWSLHNVNNSDLRFLCEIPTL